MLTIAIIEQGIEIHSKLTIKTKKVCSVFAVFIVKIGLTSHLVLVYLLLTGACYCLIRFVQQQKF